MFKDNVFENPDINFRWNTTKKEGILIATLSNKWKISDFLRIWTEWTKKEGANEKVILVDIRNQHSTFSPNGVLSLARSRIIKRLKDKPIVIVGANEFSRALVSAMLKTRAFNINNAVFFETMEEARSFLGIAENRDLDASKTQNLGAQIY